MKIILLFTSVLIMAWTTSAEDLPKGAFGKYGGEMPAYNIMVDGQPIAINAHDVYITLTGEKIIYIGGQLELSGTYSVFKQGKNEYVVKAQLTNGKSVSYTIDFTWNKKENKIYMIPKNGQVAVQLERM